MVIAIITVTLVFTVSCMTGKTLNTAKKHVSGESNSVSLSIVERKNQTLLLRLEAADKKQFFLTHEKEEDGTFFVPYSLYCTETGKEGVEFAPGWHSLPISEKLMANPLFFKVPNIPNINGNCRISISIMKIFDL